MVTTPVRLVRTPSSERFALRRGETDVALLDIHYALGGRVHATLVGFDGLVEESEVPSLLTFIDEQLLPEVSVDDGLVFTVVLGRVIGAFQATADADTVASNSPQARER